MNYTVLFYWLTVADNAKEFFGWSVVLFSLVLIASTIAFFVGREEDLSCPEGGAAERAKRWVWFSTPLAILFWSLYIFTPSKKNALLIVAGGQTLNYLTNDSTARQIPHEALNFVVTELRSMAGEAKVELDMYTQKERILNEAKKMSGVELMEKMSVDSVFRRIVLDK